MHNLGADLADLPPFPMRGGEPMSTILDNLVSRTRAAVVHGEIAVDTAINFAVDSVLEVGSINSAQEPALRFEMNQQLFGFGPLQPLLDDPEIEEIWVNSPTQVFVAVAGRSRQLDLSIAQHEIESIVERMLRPTGRRLDRSSPFVDASLPDGSRLHVAIPDITKGHWSINVRKFSKQMLGLHDLAMMGSLTFDQADFLANQMRQGKNILVSGATQAGKTTLLGALLSAVDPNERVISVEETFELRLPINDWVALQTRQASLEGAGEVSLRRLIKESLRMRPSRIVVGEVREAESLDLLIALNSGLPGACTIHANSAQDAIVKLCTLPLLAGANISSAFVNPTVGACIDLVVHCELGENGKRAVAEIASVEFNNGVLEVTRL